MSPRDRVRYAAKTVIAHLLYYLGVLHLMRRVLLRRKAVVLMYHRVLTADQCRQTASQPGIIVERRTFARQMRVLKRLFKVITLEEFVDRLERRVPFEGPCCLITFDDGWLDNLQNALPVLREHGLPAAIFLPVNFVGTRRVFTREALTHLLVRTIEATRAEPGRREGFRARLAPLGLAGVLDLPAHGNALDAAIEVLGTHRFASGPEFETLVADLCSQLGIPEHGISELDTFIDWSEVACMAQHGVTFGGHGAEHRVLTRIELAQVRDEVATSKDVLQARLGKAPLAFAYPNGGWNREVAGIVRDAGYRLAFTIEPGAVDCRDDCFNLPRVNIHEGMTRATPMFLARVTGLF